MGFSLRRITVLPVFFSLCVLLSFSSIPPVAIALKGIDVENPAVDVTPSISVVPDGSKGAAFCERVQVLGISRLKLAKYATAYRVMVAPSVVIPERLHNKIQICIQRNSSLGLCQCGKDDWKTLQKGVLISVGSPYEDRYIDVKFAADLSGSVTVTIQEDFQQWRLALLALGMVLFFLSPVISSWVPFYYSSSMAIGVCVVVLILLFQGMKLLPTNRKNFFYLSIYGSVLGAGSFLLKHFSMMVNSLLVNFGLSEEMHNPVSVFLFVGIVIAGAGLGYWLVRKFVIAEDGSVDVGIAQFVKWAIRTIAVTLILQSTLDTPLAIVVLSSCLMCYFLFTTVKWDEAGLESFTQSGSSWPWSTVQTNVKQKRAEFYSRPWKKDNRSTIWDIPKGSFPKPSVKVPTSGLLSPAQRVNKRRQQQDSYSPSGRRSTRSRQDFYSTYHKTPSRKKYTQEEWEQFTQESTRQALADLTSSPEFTEWVIDSADRMQILPDDTSDETLGSGSDSTDEQVFQNTNGFGLFKW